MQANKLDLVSTNYTSTVVSSILTEPISKSFALMLSDSSILLYSFPSPSVQSPIILCPPFYSSASFLRIHSNPSSSSCGRTFFLTVSSHNAGSAILLRSWILSDENRIFTPHYIRYKKDHGSEARLAASIDLPHGFSVRVSGSINVLVLYSISSRKIWILGAKLADSEGNAYMNLMKCAVIDCPLPIYTIRVSPIFLILGEANGVRVFPLRPLIKGRAKNKQKKCSNNDITKKNMKVLKNEAVKIMSGRNGVSGDFMIGLNEGVKIFNSELGAPVEVSFDKPKTKTEVDGSLGKARTMKLKQDSCDVGSFFASFKCSKNANLSRRTTEKVSKIAVSIHVLSKKYFVILDSVGDLHLLNLHEICLGHGSQGLLSRDYCMKPLEYTMKVQMLSALPDISQRSPILWLSDGYHSLHVVSLEDILVGENQRDAHEEKSIQISAIQTIFTSEKIRDIVPLAENTVAILGQGNVFAYTIP